MLVGIRAGMNGAVPDDASVRRCRYCAQCHAIRSLIVHGEIDSERALFNDVRRNRRSCGRSFIHIRMAASGDVGSRVRIPRVPSMS